MAGASRCPRTTVHAARRLGSAGWLAARGEGKPASVQWRGRVAPRSCERIRQPGSTARAGARPYTARRPGGGTRQCGVMELECLLRHRHAPPTRCVLRLAAPVADVRRLTELLGERLSTLTLPEPVRACELRSSSLAPRALSSKHLWQPGEHGGGSSAEAS